MATQTQTLRRPVINPERRHDYLYDTHYVVSSERDHARATFKAHTSTDRVKRVPIYKTMFSELRHEPRFQMRLDVTDPVPRFINRQWRGYQDQQREALIRYTTFNYDPHVQVPAVSYEDARVSGVNRYKYFRRPIIPFLQQVPPEVLLATARQDQLTGADLQLERPPTPLTRTVEVQTDYRDSETQTDPYTPEYVVRPGEQPELLTLATLSYGRGLPAGLAEVEMIERARAKRAWEATLPPLNDSSQLEKRRKMMDEMERHEWALREQEIEKLQEARLEVLKKLLKQREENHQELNIKRLDRLWSKKQEEKESKIRHIRNEHIKAIRKLTKKRQEVEGKLERRDIVHDYSSYGSQAYAPKTRIGIFLDRGSEQYVVKSHYLNSYHGLLELEQSLPQFVINPRVKAPKPKTVTKTGFTKRKYRQEQELRELHQVIKEAQEAGEEAPKPIRFLQKIEKPIPRPPTPAVEVPSQEEEERELAVIFLQQVIRGRAIQNMMFEGKEKRMELIRELRSTHALQEAEQAIKKQEKQGTLALQRQRRLHEHKESFIDEALSQMEGHSVGDMLDFLSKELIRLQEERRIHAFAMLAERQRRIREAEESGRRQVEERRRREEDEIFKQVVKCHQNTVDTYLEDVILNAVDCTADEQARCEVQEMAEVINDVAYEIEETRTQLDSEEIVAELVHTFLLPEAQKETVREKIKRQQRKYLLAAHNEIHKDGEGIIKSFSKGGVEEPASTSGTPTNSELPTETSASFTAPGAGASRPTSASATDRPASQTQRSASHTSSRPPSGRGSRPSSARSDKAPSRKSSTHSEKPASRKSSSASQKETPLDLSVEGKAPTPPGSKPASRKSSAASLKESPREQGKETSRASSRKGSSSSVRKDGAETPKQSSSRRGSAASEKEKSSTPKEAGSRRGSATSVKEGKTSPKEDSATPKGSRPSSRTSVEKVAETPKEGSRRGSAASQKEGRTSPKDSGTRPASASSVKKDPETAKEDSRPGSGGSNKSGHGSAKKESPRQEGVESPKDGAGSRRGSATSVKSQKSEKAE